MQSQQEAPSRLVAGNFRPIKYEKQDAQTDHSHSSPPQLLWTRTRISWPFILLLHPHGSHMEPCTCKRFKYLGHRETWTPRWIGPSHTWGGKASTPRCVGRAFTPYIYVIRRARNHKSFRVSSRFDGGLYHNAYELIAAPSRKSTS